MECERELCSTSVEWEGGRREGDREAHTQSDIYMYMYIYST